MLTNEGHRGRRHGAQIALARIEYDPMNPILLGGIYLSAARSVLPADDNSSAELVYRGNGRWTLVDPVNASGFLAMTPVHPAPAPQ